MDARAGIKPPETAVSTMGSGGSAAATKAIALSPLNKRRWENFKANRRGYWSLWLFLAMFVISLFAEFICQRQADLHITSTADRSSRLSSPIPTRPSQRTGSESVRHRRRLS